jgi:hypothetical protein
MVIIVTLHVYRLFVGKTSNGNLIVVLQIVINIGFYYRKSYRLQKKASKLNTKCHLSA